MAYEMVMPYHLHMPSYFLETFTEYPFLNKEKKHHRKSDFYIMKSHPINQRRKSVINIAKEKMQSKKRICKCLLPNSIYRFLFILFLQNEHVLYFSNAFINSFFTVSTPGKPVCF